MAMPMFVVKLIKKTFPGLFTVAKTTKVPLLGRAIEYALFENDDIMYLPKDRVIEVGKKVDGRSDVVLPSQVIDHFIEKAGKIWIMDTCICRESLTCKDYPIDLGCMFMGEASEKINPKLGRPVSKEEAREHVRKCGEAGLVHLIGRNKLDAVWLGVGPAGRLLTVCNCCPCCCLWRAIPHLKNDISEKVTRMPGVEVRVTDDCVGCGTCSEDGVCFVKAISLEGDRAIISEECRGCGRCVETCPNDAIELVINDPSFMESCTKRVAKVVDVS